MLQTASVVQVRQYVVVKRILPNKEPKLRLRYYLRQLIQQVLKK